MPAIFISHSSRDTQLADEIKAWLQSQGYERVFLDFDKHTGLRAGGDWERQLYTEIERSHAVILILTPNWLKSKWCFVEFAQARALGKIIFPLVLSPLGHKRVAPEIQGVDLKDWNTEGQLYLSRRIREVTDEVARGFVWDRARSPYPGIHSFDQEDAAIYFGRDYEIREVIERLEARRVQGGKRLLLIVGGSGSGKSSLLKAGVIPQLLRERRHWIVAPAFRPEHDPITNLVKSLTHCAGQPDTWRQWRDRVAGGDAANIKDVIDDLRVGDALNATLLIPIDQFEETFTLTTTRERAAFLNLLQLLVGPQQPACQVVATVRSDILNELLLSREFSLPFEDYLLGPISLECVPKVIGGPAGVAAIAIETHLPERICRDLSSPEALPLLAFLLREMYERFGTTRRFTSADYESLGDPEAKFRPIENAVRRRAEDVLNATRPDAGELDALKCAFIPNLVRARDDGVFVRQPARLSQLPAAAHRHIEAFVDARLLTKRAGPEASDDATVEVAHEALFKAWPRLRGWIDDEREFLAGKAQLAREMADFNAAKPDESRLALLQGIRLRRAEQWLRTHPAGLTSAEVSFIQASQREVLRRRILAATGALTIAAVVVLAVFTVRWGYLFYVQRTALECDRLAAELQNDVGLPGVEFSKIDTERAIPACESALLSDPDNPRLMDELGRSLERAGRYTEAVSWYSKAVAMRYAWAQDNLGALYLEGRRNQDGQQVVPVDFTHGVALLRAAAEQNNARAIVNYAERDFRPIFEDSPVRVTIVETALVARGLLQRTDATATWSPALDAALNAFKRSERLGEKDVTLRVLDRLGVIAELSHTIKTGP